MAFSTNANDSQTLSLGYHRAIHEGSFLDQQDWCGDLMYPSIFHGSLGTSEEPCHAICLQCVNSWHSASAPLFFPWLSHQYHIDLDHPNNRIVMANHHTPLSTLASLTTYMCHDVVPKAICGCGTRPNAVSADLCTPVLRKCLRV